MEACASSCETTCSAAKAGSTRQEAARVELPLAEPDPDAMRVPSHEKDQTGPADGRAVDRRVRALWGMQSTTPNYNRLLAPIETRGDAGTFVRGRRIALRVDGMDVARQLRGSCIGGTQLLDTGGVWVIVHATAASVERTETLTAAAIESADGTRYLKSERPTLCSSLLPSMTLQPDVPTSGDLIFELPAEALPGAHLIAPQRHSALGRSTRSSASDSASTPRRPRNEWRQSKTSTSCPGDERRSHGDE